MRSGIIMGRHRVWILGSLCALAIAGCELQEDVLPPAPTAAPQAGSNIPPYVNPSPSYAASDQPAIVGNQPSAPQVAQHTGQIRFVRGYEAGMKYAASVQMPVLLFFTAEWCHFCHQMADDAFTNPQVVGLSERFVCVLIDADAEPEVCKRFRVQGFPTVQFLTPTGAQLNRLVGKKPSHQVMMAMQAALQNLARRNPPDVRTTR
jgi:thiol-disulfide isomerase/thioredoxin